MSQPVTLDSEKTIKSKPEKMNQSLFHVIIVLVSILVTYYFPNYQEKFAVNDPVELRKAYVIGLAVSSIFWMLGALLIGPLSILMLSKMPTYKMQQVRRTLGIWTAILLFSHLIGLWHYFYGWSAAKALNHGYFAFTILHAALFYIVLMGITSNNYSVKKLGKYWKGFHRGIYVLYPAIAVAEVFEFYRVQSPMYVMIVVGSTGVIIPALQLMARAKYKKLYARS